jgi:hypothetical protein
MSKLITTTPFGLDANSKGIHIVAAMNLRERRDGSLEISFSSAKRFEVEFVQSCCIDDKKYLYRISDSKLDCLLNMKLDENDKFLENTVESRYKFKPKQNSSHIEHKYILFFLINTKSYSFFWPTIVTIFKKLPGGNIKGTHGSSKTGNIMQIYGKNILEKWSEVIDCVDLIKTANISSQSVINQPPSPPLPQLPQPTQVYYPFITYSQHTTGSFTQTGTTNIYTQPPTTTTPTYPQLATSTNSQRATNVPYTGQAISIFDNPIILQPTSSALAITNLTMYPPVTSNNENIPGATANSYKFTHCDEYNGSTDSTYNLIDDSNTVSRQHYIVLNNDNDIGNFESMLEPIYRQFVYSQLEKNEKELAAQNSNKQSTI